MLKILAIGDVTTPRAAEALAASLWDIRKAHGVDFVAVNAENAGFIMGPTPDIARTLLNGGADVLTGGAVLFTVLMKNLGFTRIIASDRDNLEGYAIKKGFMD